MEFWERIEAEIVRGRMRNADDEEIAVMERGLVREDDGGQLPPAPHT